MTKRILGLSLTIILTSALFFSCGRHSEQNENVASKEVAANIQKVTLDVQGMTCSGCEYNVESAIKQIDGVAKVKADFSSHSAVVEFYPETATVDKMVEAVNKGIYGKRDEIKLRASVGCSDFSLCEKTNTWGLCHSPKTTRNRLEESF